MSSVGGTGRDLGYGLQKEGGLNWCFQHELGSSVRRPTGLRPVVEGGRKCPHQLPGNASSVASPSCLFTGPEGAPHSGPLGCMTMVAYINHQGGLSSRRLFTLVECLLEWAQHNLCSLRATHMPVKLNQGADMLSWGNVPCLSLSM